MARDDPKVASGTKVHIENRADVGDDAPRFREAAANHPSYCVASARGAQARRLYDTHLSVAH